MSKLQEKLKEFLEAANEEVGAQKDECSSCQKSESEMCW